MDTIATIIVTAFVNIAISNFLFYRYQKKVETSFARSLFEYQTKFSRTYPKTIEILEKFIQKFNHFFHEYSALTNSIKLSISGANLRSSYPASSSLDTSLKQEDVEMSQLGISMALDDCDYCFGDNRFYLPDNAIQQIKEVIVRMTNLSRYLSAYTRHSDRTQEDLLKFMGKLIQAGHMKFPDEKSFEKIIPTDENALITFIEILDNELDELSKLVEGLYKSMAGAT